MVEIVLDAPPRPTRVESERVGSRPVFAETVDAFDPDQWDRLAPGMMADRRWLRALESAADGDERPRYLALEEREGLTAAALVREIRTSASVASPDHLLLGRLRRPLGRFGVSFVPCLLVAPHRDFDPALFGPRRAALLDGLVERAEARGLPLIFRRVAAGDLELRRLLEDRGFVATADTPVAYMDIAWTDFDGYLDSLRARSRSLPNKVRSEIRRCARAGIEIREIADPEPLADTLHALAVAHHLRLNPEVPYPYDRHLFAALRRHLGEGCLIHGAFAGDRLVGFGVMVHDGEVGHLPFCGFAPEARDSFAYFNLGYYLPIRLAIELGLRRLHCGALQWRTKARRGYDFMPTVLYYRAPSRTKTLVAGPLFRLHRRLAERYRFSGVPRG